MFGRWGRNKFKLDRNERALVRALAKRGKWELKEIAAVFHASLPLIKRTVANSYTAISDREWEDEDFYNQSDLEELILGVSLENSTACPWNSCITFAAAAGCPGEQEQTKGRSNYQS